MEIAADGERAGVECRNADIELFIFNDAVLGFDEEVAHSSDSFALGTISASGLCEDVQVSRGYYSQLRVNGEVVAESARVDLGSDCPG